jgi:hypothetical protein
MEAGMVHRSVFQAASGLGRSTLMGCGAEITISVPHTEQ